MPMLVACLRGFVGGGRGQDTRERAVWTLGNAGMECPRPAAPTDRPTDRQADQEEREGGRKRWRTGPCSRTRFAQPRPEDGSVEEASRAHPWAWGVLRGHSEARRPAGDHASETPRCIVFLALFVFGVFGLVQTEGQNGCLPNWEAGGNKVRLLLAWLGGGWAERWRTKRPARMHGPRAGKNGLWYLRPGACMADACGSDTRRNRSFVACVALPGKPGGVTALFDSQGWRPG